MTRIVLLVASVCAGFLGLQSWRVWQLSEALSAEQVINEALNGQLKTTQEVIDAYEAAHARRAAIRIDMETLTHDLKSLPDTTLCMDSQPVRIVLERLHDKRSASKRQFAR